MQILDIFRSSIIRLRLGRSGRYLPLVNNRIYYETYGRGRPLLCLHGGLSTLRTFRYQLPALARHFKVYLPERSGHGHSPDIPGPFTYDQMADETAAFIRALQLDKPDVFGYSDGANLVFALAKRHPGLIGKFVCLGGNFHHNGCDPAFNEMMAAIPPGEVGPDGIDENYAADSPDGPEHYAEVFAKARRLWLEEPTWDAAALSVLEIPTLVIAGDRDVVLPEHSVALFRALPKAQLAILPGATHRLHKEHPKLVNRMLLDFLLKPFPEPDDFVEDITA